MEIFVHVLHMIISEWLWHTAININEKKKNENKNNENPTGWNRKEDGRVGVKKKKN